VILSLDINGITGSTSIPMSRPWTRLPRHNGAPAHPTPQPARIQALVWGEHEYFGKARLQSFQPPSRLWKGTTSVVAEKLTKGVPSVEERPFRAA